MREHVLQLNNNSSAENLRSFVRIIKEGIEDSYIALDNDADMQERKKGQLEEATEEYYRKLLHDPNYYLFALKDQTEQIIGVMEIQKVMIHSRTIISKNIASMVQIQHYFANEQIGLVHWICIARDHRRKDIGTTLYDYCKSILPHDGISGLIVMILEANKASLNFHRKIGFKQEIGERNDQKAKWYGIRLKSTYYRN